MATNNAQAEQRPTVRAFIVVFVVLMALLVLTVLVARLDLGVYNAVAAMVIAAVKARARRRNFYAPEIAIRN